MQDWSRAQNQTAQREGIVGARALGCNGSEEGNIPRLFSIVTIDAAPSPAFLMVEKAFQAAYPPSLRTQRAHLLWPSAEYHY